MLRTGIPLGDRAADPGRNRIVQWDRLASVHSDGQHGTSDARTIKRACPGHRPPRARLLVAKAGRSRMEAGSSR
jgi:hypothetical protein